MIAKIYLSLVLLLFGFVGLASLIAPDVVAARLHLLPQSTAGTAEIRGLYGGAFLSWCLIIIAAWRWKSLRQGLLIALALTMGSIVAARIVSLAIDHQGAFNVPAIISEALIALACWFLYKGEKTSQQPMD